MYAPISNMGEPVWPSGKALGWEVEGPRFSIALALLSLQKGCGLWTPSCDSITSSWNIKMALIAAHLNAGIILVVTV